MKQSLGFHASVFEHELRSRILLYKKVVAYFRTKSSLVNDEFVKTEELNFDMPLIVLINFVVRSSVVLFPQ